jgi:hypothetical protein
MKNKIGRVLLTGLLSGTMLLGLIGCGKPTAESLLTKMIESGKKMESATAIMKYEGKIEAAGQTIEMSMDMDMDLSTDPSATHIKGIVGVTMLGEEQITKMEVYGIQNDKDEMELYATLDGDTWTKTTEKVEDADVTSLIGLGDDLLDTVASFKLGEKTVQVNDVECYRIRGAVKGTMVEEIMNMAGMGENELLGELDWEDAKIPMELNISKKTGDIVSIRINMADLMRETMESTVGEYADELAIEGFIAEITYENVNEIGKIEVPDKVKKAAE